MSGLFALTCGVLFASAAAAVNRPDPHTLDKIQQREGQEDARPRLVRRHDDSTDDSKLELGDHGHALADDNDNQNTVCSPTSQYCTMILQDLPVAYWRLNDPMYDSFGNVSFKAHALGTAGSSVDGLIEGAPEYQTTGLLGSEANDAMLLTGERDQVIRIPDSPYINTGDFYDARTVELWFKPTMMTTTPQVLYDEGDGERGITIWITKRPGYDLMDVGSPGHLHFFVYNRGSGEVQFGGDDGIDWGPISCEIQQGNTYFAALVFAGGNQSQPRIEAWYRPPGNQWTVSPCGNTVDLPQYASLRRHTESACIGNLCGVARISNTSVLTSSADDLTSAHNFHGVINDVVIFNRHLHRTSLDIHSIKGTA